MNYKVQVGLDEKGEQFRVWEEVEKGKGDINGDGWTHNLG